ncbi:MAG: deoxyguanosinetriphosphate triphosphohydrolase, partial [bacterium]|nr:deoxyguanosinetriphosphate triphosphohydrolase [bacterium]
RERNPRPNPNSSDLRTEFEKDYHRIIGSASFRRLQDKTQVFPLDRSDFIRTRLTHSLEVSSFAKSLGQNISEMLLKDKMDESFLPSYKQDVCDILQCAGLLHDIGNPPFGHFGETAIREWFRKNLSLIQYNGKPVSEILTEQMREDFYHFEGNTQALRVVTKLHYLVDEHGMNLTKGLLGTIIKYPIASNQIVDPKSQSGQGRQSGQITYKKMGYYYADRDVFNDIEESTGTRGCRHPLTFLLEAADDIAYKTADIEDAYKKGCLSFEKFLWELNEKKADVAEAAYSQMVEDLQKRYDKALERRIDNPEIYALQNWIVRIQGRMIQCATGAFKEHYHEIMEGTYAKDLFAGTDVKLMMDVLGDVAYRYAFISKPILKLEIAADSVFRFLLERFVDAVIYYDTETDLNDVQKKLISLISENYKTIYKIYSKDKNDTEKLYLRLLLVTDSICGMTDSYAKSLYQELNGIA